MTTAIKKTADGNGLYHYVINIDPANYPTADWEHDPNISAVSSDPANYWKYNGTNDVVLMSTVEQDAVDAALSTVSEISNDPVAHAYSETISFAAGEKKVIDLKVPMSLISVQITDPAYNDITGESLLSPAGNSWDPGNVSGNEVKINNGNPADLAYNNLTAGNTNGVILGIDMGSPTTISAMRRYDYSGTYFDREWEFIGTDDASAATYEVIFSAAQIAPYLTPDPFLRGFPNRTYRYFGCRCITSNNSTYSVISELELLSGTLITVSKILKEGTSYTLSILSDTQISIKSLSAEPVTYQITYIGH